MEKNINTLFSVFDMQKNFGSTSTDFSVINVSNKMYHLYEVFLKYKKELIECIHKEYSKPYWDSYISEIELIEKEIKFFVTKIKKYRKFKRVKKFSYFFNAKCKSILKPYGCCLFILNDPFPISKVILPIIGALACGNTLFVKLPSYDNEINKIIKKIIKEVFNDNFIYFINEWISDQEFKSILEFNFDLVFCSGNQTYAKNVIRSFGPRFTKIVLDINNKCPIIIDETADLQKAAKNIVWSKNFNAGQTSFSPYYLIIHESIVNSFVTALKNEYLKQFPPAQKWNYTCKIDSKKNFDVITKILDVSMQKNRVLFGGEINKDERKIELTLISIDDLKSQFLTMDLNSPILPVVIFNSFSDINGIVKHNDTPSAIYLFSKNKKRIKTLLNYLESRYFYINDITMPYTKGFWYGGVRSSGNHLYGKEESIKIFTYKRIVMINNKFKNNKDKFLEFNIKESNIKKKMGIENNS